MTKRLFIAIPLTADVKSAVSAYAQKLDLNLAWSKTDNLHITLAFLGDTSDEKISVIKQTLNTVAENYQPFTISLSQIGYFRNSGALWIDVAKGREQLEQLANLVRDELTKNQIDFDDRHSFIAHLTIARNKKQIEVPRDLPDFPPTALPINKIMLFESQLTRPQVTYTELHTSRL